MDTEPVTATPTRLTAEQLDSAACLEARIAVRLRDRGEWGQAARAWTAAADDWSAGGFTDAACAAYAEAAACQVEADAARPRYPVNVAALLD